MMNKDQLIKAASNDDKLLEALIPGGNPKTETVRAQIKSFASNTSSSCALLIGPIGTCIFALMRKGTKLLSI
jgi:hypothetical protein